MNISDIFKLIAIVESKFLEELREYSKLPFDSITKDVELSHAERLSELRQLKNSLSIELSQKLSNDFRPAIKALLNNKQKIEAVKMARNILGCSLLEAKTLVESIEKQV